MSAQTADQTEVDPEAELASILGFLADSNFRGYSPTYEHLARRWAEDPELLALTAHIDRSGMIPIKVLAAVHDLTLREPDLSLASSYRGDVPEMDPYPAFRQLLIERWAEIAECVATRKIQTNEVGRTATLVPALTWLTGHFGGRDLALVEIGPSAGLNLLLDRYHVDYDDGRSTGDASSSVRLSCAMFGSKAPLPEAPFPIRERVGIDLRPIDPRDPNATRWLEACLWPDVPDRAERLRAALAIARSNPPRLVEGDVVDHLGPILDAIPVDVVPIVFSTWALAYLDKEGRQATFDLVAARAATRDLALLNAEYPHVISWVPPTRRPLVEEGADATLLGATTWCDGDETSTALAWTHAHGQWLDWLAEPAPGPGAGA